MLFLWYKGTISWKLNGWNQTRPTGSSQNRPMGSTQSQNRTYQERYYYIILLDYLFFTFPMWIGMKSRMKVTNQMCAFKTKSIFTETHGCYRTPTNRTQPERHGYGTIRCTRRCQTFDVKLPSGCGEHLKRNILEKRILRRDKLLLSKLSRGRLKLSRVRTQLWKLELKCQLS